MTDVSRGLLTISDKMTLGNLLERWMETCIRNKKRPATTANYQNQVNTLTKSLGLITLEKLNPLQIEEHYNEESKRGLKLTSVQYQHAVLKQALDKAVKWRLITFNPCDAVDAPKRNKPKNAVYTPEQVQAFLDFSQTQIYTYPSCWASWADCGEVKYADLENLMLALMKCMLIFFTA